jgi:hypothetical protein
LKKGQLQIQESIFVLFAFFIILAIGMIVFYQMEFRSIDNIQQKNEDVTFYYLISYLPSMPELVCSEKTIVDECMDITKARVFGNLDDEYYKKVFGHRKIILKAYGEDVELYDWKPLRFSAERKITTPVSVFNPRDGSYIIGVLEVYDYEE